MTEKKRRQRKHFQQKLPLTSLFVFMNNGYTATAVAFLLYRKQAISTISCVFLLFLKQAEYVFLLFPKHQVVWGEKNPAVVGRRIVEVL